MMMMDLRVADRGLWYGEARGSEEGRALLNRLLEVTTADKVVAVVGGG
jgi:hypothetical protein